MRFTAGDLRGAIANPEPTIHRLRSMRASGVNENTPHSPQRSWIEASLRRYYAARRNPDALIGDYRRRTGGKGTYAARRSKIANGEAMLQAFLTLEEPQPNPRKSRCIPAQINSSWDTSSLWATTSSMNGSMAISSGSCGLMA